MKLIYETKSDNQIFAVESGKLRVTDPCYPIDIWCGHTLENVKNGQWFAKTGRWSSHNDKIGFERSIANKQTELEQSKNMILEILKEGGMSDQELAEKENKLKESWPEIIKLHTARQKRAFVRTTFLHISHSKTKPKFDDGLSQFSREETSIGVDSGQAGFFDYPNLLAAQEGMCDGPRSSQTGAFKEFYDAACDLTGGDIGFGTFAFGVVSDSGWGDGGYPLFVRRNEKGQLIEAVIVYICD